MTPIEAKPEWSDVPQIEVGDRVRGGKDGPVNKQAQALANRIEKLKEDQLQDGVEVLEAEAQWSDVPKLNGEHSNVQAQALVNRTDWLKDLVLDVKSFGAKDYYEDPLFDSSLAFNTAAAAARIVRKTLRADGRFTLGAQVDLRGVPLDMDGADIQLSHSGIGILLGGSSSSGWNPVQRVRSVRRVSGVPSGAPEIRVIGAKNQDIHVQYTDYIQLYATTSGADFAQTDSIAYSNFYFNRLLKLELASDPTNTNPTPDVQYSTKQWINENNFYLARCTDLIVGTVGAVYKHNHNRFYGGTFEGTASITFNIGRDNRMYNLRFEKGPTTIYFSQNCDRNTIHTVYDESDFNGGDTESPIDDGTITDLGNANSVIDDFRLWYLTETVAYADINDVVLNNEVGPTSTRRPYLQCIQGGSANQSVLESQPLPVRSQDVIKFYTEGAESSDVVLYRPYIIFYDKDMNQLTPQVSWITSVNMNTISAGAISTSTGVSQQVLRIQDGAISAGAFFCKVGFRASAGQIGGGLARRAFIKHSTQAPFLRSSLAIPNRQIQPKTVSALPTQGFAPAGYVVPKSDGTAFYICTFSHESTSSSAAPASSSTIQVSNASGVSIGDRIGINMPDRSTHWTAVTSVSGNEIGLYASLPLALEVGSRVVFVRWVSK